MIKIIKSKREHIEALKDNLRKQDLIELSAMLGQDQVDTGKVLLRGLKGKHCWTILRKDNNKVIGMFGVARYTQKGVGNVWMLGSDDIEQVGLSVLRNSRGYVKRMLQEFDVIHNMVHVENTTSINWLKWCGFKFDDNELDINGKIFKYFYMEKAHV